MKTIGSAIFVVMCVAAGVLVAMLAFAHEQARTEISSLRQQLTEARLQLESIEAYQNGTCDTLIGAEAMLRPLIERGQMAQDDISAIMQAWTAEQERLIEKTLDRVESTNRQPPVRIEVHMPTGASGSMETGTGPHSGIKVDTLESQLDQMRPDEPKYRFPEYGGPLFPPGTSKADFSPKGVPMGGTSAAAEPDSLTEPDLPDLPVDVAPPKKERGGLRRLLGL